MAEPVFFRRKRLNQERAKALYDIGYCDQQIADECDVSKECVREWRRRNGLKGYNAPYKDKKSHKKEPAIITMAMEAKAHKMSYGQYMAARREGMI